MRYNLESTLPIHAFQPLGGRHSPFKHGMTLEGGGGGIISGIGDAIGGIAEGVGDALAGVDDFVGDTIPGGWGTVAAIAVPYAAPYLIAGATGATVAASALTAGQAAALAAGTRAVTGIARGEDTEDILKGAATAGATSYGLNSLFGDAGYVPDEGSPYIDGTPPPSYSYVPDEGSPYLNSVPPDSYVQPDMDLNAPYIDTPDGELLLTPDSTSAPPVDTVPNVDAISDLSVISPYIDSPDGLTQLGYSPDELAAITSSSTPPPLSSEKELRKIYEANINDLGAGTSPYGEANELSSINESVKDPFANPRPNFSNDPLKYLQNQGSDALDYIKNAPKNTLDYFTDPNKTISDMGSDLYKFAGDNYGKIGLGALVLSNMGGQQPQPQGQPTAADSRYTGGYGSSGGVANPYLLRNRVTASNVYDYENPYDRYGSVNRRYAQGGEVKHFAFGGISNALSRIGQPFEKAIVQPIGQALPFLKDVAPYAGILAAPFIGSPIAAAGIGALSSGFGRPGSGFDMKRALMGGIAAYGASTVGAGLEAAGGQPPPVDLIGESYAVPGTVQPTSLNEAVSKPFFRDVGAMERGVGNLLSPSTYDAAATKFGTQAGIYKTGVPLVIGTSGMMAVDEAQKMKEEAERSAGVGRQEQADMLARIAKGKKRAEEAVRENPYMYAMGGQIDDELGGDYSAMGMDQGNMQKGLFGLGYAAGGMPNLALSRLSQPAFNEGAVGGMQQFATGGSPRFLSGGGDGMSDSIPATIGGTQEARLADGEFVIPADVVSHLGNGSSKAGAKQLYSMMDRVRKARTGNKKQGRQIKPKKMMPA